MQELKSLYKSSEYVSSPSPRFLKSFVNHLHHPHILAQLDVPYRNAGQVKAVTLE